MKRFILAVVLRGRRRCAGLGRRRRLRRILSPISFRAGNRKAALEQIRAGADVNEAQPDGTRPIHWAVYRVDYELLDALIAKKAKVDVANEFGSTPLAEAAKLADARMVKTLLDAGADPRVANQDGETALMLAIKTGELPIVEMLIKAGANVNAVEKFHNQTPLMWAAAAPKNAGEMVKLLLSKDANVKPRALYNDWPSQITSEPRAQYRPVGGLTALLYAARDGCYDCVEALIGAGADVNVPTPEGVTPLMIALDNDHNDVAKLLLDRGANPQRLGLVGTHGALHRHRSKGVSRWRGGGRGGAAGTRRRGPWRRTDRGAPRGFAAVRPSPAWTSSTPCWPPDVDPQSAAQYASPQPGRQQRTFRRQPLSTGCTPLSARDDGQRYGSRSRSCWPRAPIRTSTTWV